MSKKIVTDPKLVARRREAKRAMRRYVAATFRAVGSSPENRRVTDKEYIAAMGVMYALGEVEKLK